MAAAESLLLLGDRSGIPVLKAALSSGHKSRVARSARILAAAGDDSGLEKMRPMLTSTDRNERSRAFMGFAASLNPAEAFPALRKAVDDDDRIIRQTALTALEKRPGPESIEILGSVLKSTHKEDHGIAAGMLIRSRRVEAIPHLIEALTDDSPAVRRTAAVGLTHLAGRPITPRTKARVAKLEDARLLQNEWRQWWQDNKATFVPGPPAPPQFAEE
jgi:HEAT repeat protein